MNERYIVVERGAGECEVWRRCNGVTGCSCGEVYHTKVATTVGLYARLIAKTLSDAEGAPTSPDTSVDREAGEDTA